MTPAEKNDHYGALNDRFDGRARRLHKLGFRYQHVEAYGIAIFLRANIGRKPTTIQASFVLCADDVCWSDRIADVSADAFPIPA